MSKNSPSKNSRWRNLKITGGAEDVFLVLVSFWAVPLCRPFVRFRIAKMEQTTDKKSRFPVVSVVCFSYRDMFYFPQMQGEQDNFLHVPKYGLNWYIYKVSKKNQKKVKKNLVDSFFCRTFVTEKERNNNK